MGRSMLRHYKVYKEYGQDKRDRDVAGGAILTRARRKLLVVDGGLA
jgi:hypothetical protein